MYDSLIIHESLIIHDSLIIKVTLQMSPEDIRLVYYGMRMQ